MKASNAGSVSTGTTLAATGSGTLRLGLFNPNRLAYLTQRRARRASCPRLPKAVLQDSQERLDDRRVAVAAGLVVVVDQDVAVAQRQARSGPGTVAFVPATRPVEKAAELVMILNVEPGG